MLSCINDVYLGKIINSVLLSSDGFWGPIAIILFILLVLVVVGLISKNSEEIEENNNVNSHDSSESADGYKNHLPTWHADYNKTNEELAKKNKDKIKVKPILDSIPSKFFLFAMSIFIILVIVGLALVDARSKLVGVFYKSLVVMLPVGAMSLLWLLVIITTVTVIGWCIAGRFRNAIIKKGNTKPVHERSVYKLYAYVADISIKIIAIIVALACVGVNVSVLVASLGIGGFAIGFASKDILSNVLAGVLIVAYRPFKIGDTISVSGCTGEVVDMNIRYTELSSEDQIQKIPNSIVYSSVLNIKKTETNEAESVSDNQADNENDNDKFNEDTGC